MAKASLVQAGWKFLGATVLWSSSALVVVTAGLVACDSPGGRGGQLTGDATSAPDTSGDTTVGDTGVGDTTVGDTTIGDTGGPNDTNVPDTGGAPLTVDPRCIDGQYDEEIPDDGSDISGLVAAYQPSQFRKFVDDVLGVRYPIGQYLVRQAVALGAASFGNCIDLFTSDRNSAAGIIDALSTVVHECGHIADIQTGGFKSAYLVRDDLDFLCTDASGRSGKTFARSLLNGDAYAALLPGDFYRDVYLDGDPNNGQFEGGDQGFDSVLEETTQYVNSLVVDWVFSDQRSRGSAVSARDGILTFLWYIERYLRLARLEHASAYQLITTNECWREATLTVWGRAWLYLELTDGDASLGIDDGKIEALVRDADLLSEIARLRTAAGCP